MVMEVRVNDGGRQEKLGFVNSRSQHMQEKHHNGLIDKGLCGEPPTDSASLKEQNWAHFGPTGTTESNSSENWAAFGADPVGENGFGSHDSWTTFSAVRSVTSAGEPGWLAHRTERLQESGSSDSKDVDAETEDWQHFTYSRDFSETGHNMSTSHFTTSVNFGSTLDSCAHAQSRSSGRKGRSASFPVELHRLGACSVGSMVGGLCESSRKTLKDCFHAAADLATDSTNGHSASLPRVQSLVDRRFWSHLTRRACSPDHQAWSHDTAEVLLIESLFPEEVCTLGSLSLELGVAGEEFDWSRGSEERKKRDSVSPDLLPVIFRPRKESLVDIEFDHERAAQGLAILNTEELQQMRDEMASKFTRLSDTLIIELQQRDVFIQQMAAKNRFVSALLKVQGMKHSMGVSGSVDGARGNRPWTQLAWAGKGKEEKNSGKYLQTVIPYQLPEGLHWRVSTLQQLTKVLKAISEDSDTVPSLMSEYLQSEVVDSLVREKSFQPSSTGTRTERPS